MSTAIAPVENLSAAELDQLCINTIRTLSIDAVQQANSGHPGTPMALAPLAYTIWNRALKFDPQDPQQGSRASGIPLGLGCGDHDRPARAGCGNQRWHGNRRKVARPPLQPAWLRHLQLPHLCSVW